VCGNPIPRRSPGSDLNYPRIAETAENLLSLYRVVKARRAGRQTSAEPGRAGISIPMNTSAGGAALGISITQDAVLGGDLKARANPGASRKRIFYPSRRQGPEGRPPNVSPAREGWGINHSDPERRRRGTPLIPTHVQDRKIRRPFSIAPGIPLRTSYSGGVRADYGCRW
jgi:hypothetical protein